MAAWDQQRVPRGLPGMLHRPKRGRKEQAGGDIFIHFPKTEGCVWGGGGGVGKEGRLRARGEKLCTYMLGREDGVGGMSAPQVLPVADDSLLSSSSTADSPLSVSLCD